MSLRANIEKVKKKLKINIVENNIIMFLFLTLVLINSDTR